MASNTRAYVAGNFCLLLDDKPCGLLHKVEGGGVSSDVVTEKVAPGGIQHKHLAGVKYEDFSVAAGIAMAPPFCDWIKSSWDMKHVRHSGSVIACDYNLEAQTERSFAHALITETTFPTIDAACKDAGLLTVRFAPEYTKTKKGSGKVSIDTKKVAQKMWLPQNFKLEIPGLDCTHVTKIDSFTVKSKVSENAVGELRDYEKEPTYVEFPNLKITMTASHADTWQQWFQDFLIDGKNGEDSEKSGTLHFLTPNRQADLFSIKLHNLGIFRLADEPVTANADQVHRVVAELYCERMELVAPKA